MDLFDDDDISGRFTGAFTLDEAAPKELRALKELCEVSVKGYGAAVRALASELPIQGEIADFARLILDSAGEAEKNAPSRQAAQLASREAADRAATDRGEHCVEAVLKAAFKVYRETERLFGLLRFTPDSGGVYTAYCAPDHFTLPFLAEHFAARFGSTPWAIVDEKRNVILSRRPGEEPRLHRRAAAEAAKAGAAADAWEGAWRNYHRAVNIESRKNPRPQKQFMPERYRKYLTELK